MSNGLLLASGQLSAQIKKVTSPQQSATSSAIRPDVGEYTGGGNRDRESRRGGGGEISRTNAKVSFLQAEHDGNADARISEFKGDDVINISPTK